MDASGSLIRPDISKRLKSGLVILRKGEEVGEHTTNEREEIIVVISGTARAIVERNEFDVEEGHMIFIPEKKIHNMKNISDAVLKYVYITG